MKKYNIITFGCQMNKADSERMAGILENMGLEASEDPNDADLVLYIPVDLIRSFQL